MEKIKIDHLDMKTIRIILNFYETASVGVSTYEELKNMIETDINTPNYQFNHKIVLGVIFITSFDEYIHRIGIQLININTRTLNESDINVFITSLDVLDADIKYLIASILNIFYTKFKSIPFLLTSINDIINSYIYQKVTSISHIDVLLENRIQCQQYMENMILTEIKQIAVDADVKTEYKMIVTKNQHDLSPYFVTEAVVYLANLERIPHVHIFNFLKQVRDILDSFNFITVDLLFHFQSSLNANQYRNIITGYYNAYGAAFPLNNIYTYREHPKFLINFVESALTNSELVAFTNIPHTAVDTSAVYATEDTNITPNFSSVQFVNLLVMLHATFPEKINKILKTSSSSNDLIFLGLLQQPHFEMNSSSRSILHELIIYYIKNESTNVKILKYAWNMTPEQEKLRNLILQSLQEYFTQNFSDNNLRLARITDIAFDLKAVGVLLKSASLAFGVELAMAATKRCYINLDHWMSEKLSEQPEHFIQTLMSYIQKHHPFLVVNDYSRTPSDVIRVQQDSKSLDQLVSFISNNKTKLPSDLRRKIDDLFTNYYITMEINVQTSCGDSNKHDEYAKVFMNILDRLEVLSSTEEKNYYFDQTMVDANSKSINNPREGLFNNLVDIAINPRYYYYLKDSDMFNLAVVLNRLLANKIVDGSKVLEIIHDLLSNSNYTSKFFYFVIYVFSMNRHLFHQAHLYLTDWFESPFFNMFPPFLRHSIEYMKYHNSIPLTENNAYAFNDPHDVQSLSAHYLPAMLEKLNPTYATMVSKHELNFAYIESARMLHTETVMSPLNVDTILCILNNLTESNVVESTAVLGKCLDSDGYRWFARHLVHERVIPKVNMHEVYRSLLKLYDCADLYAVVRSETVSYIKYILSILESEEQMAERRALYTLGTWLGVITVADNKPVLFHEMNVKLLLVEAGFKGQDAICRVLPFVKNFIATTKSSFVFTINNPVIISILSVLAEIYLKPDLRPALRFEIEVLARLVNAKIKSIPPSSYLPLTDSLQHMRTLLPWSVEEKDQLLFRVYLRKEAVNYEHVDATNLATVVDLIDVSNIPPHFKKAICDYIYYALDVICTWVSGRISEPIAGMVDTIVSQDFRCDPDENHFMYGAHTMAKSVTLSYAYVMVTQFHYEDIVQMLREYVEKAVLSQLSTSPLKLEVEQRNQMVYRFIQNNIDFLCAFVGKYCMERVVPTIDRRLLPEYEQRRSVSKNKHAFVPRAPLITVDSDTVPMFNTLQGPPTAQQMGVYHEFNNHMPGFNSACGKLEQHIVFHDTSEKVHLHELPGEVQKNIFGLLKHACKRLYKTVQEYQDDSEFSSVVELMDAIVGVVYYSNIRALPMVVKCALICYFEFINKKKESSNEVNHRIIDESFDIFLSIQDTQFNRKFLVSLITRAVIEFEPDVRNNIEAILALVSKRLVCLRTLDCRIAQTLYRDPPDDLTEFTIELTKALLVDDLNRGIASEYELCQTLDMLNKITFKLSLSKPLNVHVNVPKVGTYNGSSSKESSSTCSVNEESSKAWEKKVNTILREWIKLAYLKSEVDVNTNFKIFLIVMAQYGMLKSEETLLAFLKGSFEIAYGLVGGKKEIETLIKTYQVIDVLVQFVVLLVKFYSGKKSLIVPCKMNMFCKILCLINAQMSIDSNYRSKPFLAHIYERIISGIIIEIIRPDHSMEPYITSYVTCIAGFLHCINPDVFPLFVVSFNNIISNHSFIQLCLRDGIMTKNASLYSLLLCDFLRFIYPYVCDTKSTTQTVVSVFKEIVTLFNYLLEECRDFVSYYYLILVNEIPHHCYQLRNMVLVAVPTGGVEDFETAQKPQTPVVFIYLPRYIPIVLIKNTESYLTKLVPNDYLAVLMTYFENTCRFENNSNAFELLNVYVFHVADSGAKMVYSKEEEWNVENVKATREYEILKHVATSSESFVSQYMVMTAIINGIRFYSSHSLFLIHVLFGLYLSADTESFRQLIIRCLSERVVCHPPYPSGVVYTLTQLLTNKEYQLEPQSFLYLPDVSCVVNTMCRNLGLSKVDVK